MERVWAESIQVRFCRTQETIYFTVIPPFTWGELKKTVIRKHHRNVLWRIIIPRKPLPGSRRVLSPGKRLYDWARCANWGIADSCHRWYRQHTLYHRYHRVSLSLIHILPFINLIFMWFFRLYHVTRCLAKKLLVRGGYWPVRWFCRGNMGKTQRYQKRVCSLFEPLLVQFWWWNRHLQTDTILAYTQKKSSDYFRIQLRTQSFLFYFSLFIVDYQQEKPRIFVSC